MKTVGANTNSFTLEDWESGFIYNGTAHKGCLTSNLYRNDIENQGRRTIFISQAIDSLENGTHWHRLQMQALIPENSVVQVSYFARDDKNIVFHNEETDLDELFLNPQVSIEDKQNIIDSLCDDTVSNPMDMLLHKGSGRYFWLRLVMKSYGYSSPEIQRIKIECPIESFIRYLPEIYSKDMASKEFLTRFIGIFQSLYLDLEGKIDDIASNFDPEIVESDFLHWLSDWMGIYQDHIWSEEQLRKLIVEANRLYRKKGTKEGIKEIVTFYTGTEPILIEQFEVVKHAEDEEYKRLLHQLYGEHTYTFSVMVKEEEVPTTKEYVELKRIIDYYKPANTVCNLIVLKPYMFIDHHTYLGINSYLTQNTLLILDGKTAIPFNTILQESKNKNDGEGFR